MKFVQEQKMSNDEQGRKSFDEATERKDPLIAEDASREKHSKIGYGTLSTSCEKLTPDNCETVVYKRRWYILLVFCTICMSHNAVRSTWNPLYQSVQIAFEWSLSDLALLTNWGCITYVISMPLFSWMMDVKGLRWSCVVTSALIAAGCGLRCITSDPATAKWLVHVGQILNGFAGPFGEGGASLVSSVWFPAHQRTTATAISLFSASIGLSISFLIGPQLVSLLAQPSCMEKEMQNLNLQMINEWHHICNSTDHDLKSSNEWHHICNRTDQVQSTRHAIMLLMYCEFAFSLLLFLVALICFPAKPPSAPSVSAAVIRPDFTTGIKQLFKHKAFWRICLCFALSLGVSNEWFNLVAPIIKNALTLCGSESQYDEVETDWLGFSGAIIFGLFACIVARFADVFSRHMKVIIVVLFTVALVAMLGFTIDSACYVTVNKAFLFAMYIVCGIGVQSCTPIFYELACESTFPIAEGITGGLLTWLNNCVGLVFLLVLMVFPGTQWMNWTMVGCIAVCIPIIGFNRDYYNRLDIDKPPTPTPPDSPRD